jgi:hypothetical protein
MFRGKRTSTILARHLERGTMTAYTTDPTEEGRAFFQQRVALFAKVMIGVQALGLAGLLAQYPWEQLRQPWFALYQVHTGLAVGAWLLCRGGVRSVRFVSWVPGVEAPGPGEPAGDVDEPATARSLQGVLQLAPVATLR